jgi:hypothetical protein
VIRTISIIFFGCVLFGGGCGTTSAALAAVDAAPVIESTSVANITEASLTLQARVNPDGLATTYRFVLECENASTTQTFCEPGASPLPLKTGSIAAGSEGQEVSTELTGLQAGYTYVYGVIASNAEGTAESRNNIAQPAPPGACEKCANETPPYEPEASPWSIAGNNAEAERATREYEAQVARERRAAEEAAKSASERLGREREEEERRIKEEQANKPVCVVPSLFGDSLIQARRALGKAHCRLGRVTRQHYPRSGALIVLQQGLQQGRRAPQGTRVRVVVGVRRVHHRHGGR